MYLYIFEQAACGVSTKDMSMVRQLSGILHLVSKMVSNLILLMGTIIRSIITGIQLSLCAGNL